MIITLNVIHWQISNGTKKAGAKITTTNTTTVEMEWNNTFGVGGYADEAYSLIQTSDGGFALAGYTKSFESLYDMWLVKTNSTGHAEWNNTFGGRSADEAHSLIQTSDGGFALAGYTESYGAGSGDFQLVKTDANGQHAWNNTFGGSYEDHAHSLIQTFDGGFALAGSTRPYSMGWYDFWLVKTDTNGQHAWNNTFGGRYDEEAYSLIQTSDGGFALAGSTSGDIWLIKTDASGQNKMDSTTTKSTPSWTPIIVIMSLIVILFSKRMRDFYWQQI